MTVGTPSDNSSRLNRPSGLLPGIARKNPIYALPILHQLKKVLYLRFKDNIVVWAENEFSHELQKRVPKELGNIPQDISWFLFDRLPIRYCIFMARVSHTSSSQKWKQSFADSIHQYLLTRGYKAREVFVNPLADELVKKNKVEYNAVCFMAWQNDPFVLESKSSDIALVERLQSLAGSDFSFMQPSISQKIFVENQFEKPLIKKQTPDLPAPPTVTKALNEPPKKALPEGSPQQGIGNLVRTRILGSKANASARKYFLYNNNDQLRFGILGVSKKLSSDQIEFIKNVRNGNDPVDEHNDALHTYSDFPALFSFSMRADGQFHCANRGLRVILWSQRKQRFFYIPDTIEKNDSDASNPWLFKRIKSRLENGDALLLFSQQMEKKSITKILPQPMECDNIVNKTAFRQSIANRLDAANLGRALMLDFCFIKKSKLKS